MLAAEDGHLQVVQLLIEKGADVNQKNRVSEFGFRGWTALNYASSKGHTDILKCLLEAGADYGFQSDDCGDEVSNLTEQLLLFPLNSSGGLR